MRQYEFYTAANNEEQVYDLEDDDDEIPINDKNLDDELDQ
jgi:hypothetical protein